MRKHEGLLDPLNQLVCLLMHQQSAVAGVILQAPHAVAIVLSLLSLICMLCPCAHRWREFLINFPHLFVILCILYICVLYGVSLRVLICLSLSCLCSQSLDWDGNNPLQKKRKKRNDTHHLFHFHFQLRGSDDAWLCCPAPHLTLSHVTVAHPH